jgi:hypothetical protein
LAGFALPFGLGVTAALIGSGEISISGGGGGATS